MKYAEDINVRYLFRFYHKTERRYLSKKESSVIKYADLNRMPHLSPEQCTGIYDKFEIDLIYEGDVVRDDRGNIGVVYYDPRTGQYMFGEYILLTDLEIIGNCHEIKD